MARTTDTHSPNHTLEAPYEHALRRMLEYLLYNEPLWVAECDDFEEGEAAQRVDHIFPAFQAVHAWLGRGALRLELGRTVITPGVRQTVSDEELESALRRHRVGDWGDLTRDDWQANEIALGEGVRILSVYHTAQGLPFWVITEADRSVTTVLLPEEY